MIKNHEYYLNYSSVRFVAHQNVLTMSLKNTSKYCIALFACIAVVHTAYAKKARVLFIGNSYTYVNNLPQIVADVAASAGDTLVYDMSAQGGFTLSQHVAYAPTLAKIQAGSWDYVVLQDQSQLPALPPDLFDQWGYPYAKRMDSLINAYNPCAETIFYMTWGRKNKDYDNCGVYPNWPYYCSYNTMDSVLRARYMLMADSNKATVSPVGAVWRHIRGNYPGIELYDGDESHPAPAGSYAGACSFFTAIFKKPADSIKYNFSLSATDAANIRKAASKVVYDSMNFWHIGQYETIADFSHNASGMLPVSFTNKSANATQYEWNFGDGQTSTAANPTHTYTSTGTYMVRLVSTGASQCSDTAYAKVNTWGTGIADHSLKAEFIIAPNPAGNILYIRSGLFTKGNYRIQIRNSIGQLVYEQQSVGTEIQALDISALAGGMYMLNIKDTAGNAYNQKLIVR